MPRLTPALLALAAALAPAAALAEPAGPPPGYRLVWADEFDADGPPDPTKWTHDTVMNKAGWHNHELQYYAGPGSTNAVVRGGRLHITARRESPSTQADWGGQRYTSARLITRGHAEWTYGFFEIRARMPCGRGTWPAIWMLGTGDRWPDEGELDILEHMGREPERAFSTVHTAAGSGGHGVGGAQPLADACTAFHDYQMHWTHDAVDFAVDGFQHLHYPRLDAGPRAWPFDKPQFLLLNLAIGGDLGGPVDEAIFPATLEIEHVRVYQPRP
jgi:beta-glucanase (GH16 family)